MAEPLCEISDDCECLAKVSVNLMKYLDNRLTPELQARRRTSLQHQASLQGTSGGLISRMRKVSIYLIFRMRCTAIKCCRAWPPSFMQGRFVDRVQVQVINIID